MCSSGAVKRGPRGRDMACGGDARCGRATCDRGASGRGRGLPRTRIAAASRRRDLRRRVRAREQQIFPRLRLVGQVAQQVGRMVGDDQRHVAVAVDAAAQARDRRVDVEQRRRGALAQRDDELRARSARSAGRDRAGRPSTSRGSGVRLSGRPALEHVGDVDVCAAGEPERRQHVVEQAARLADEGLALRVLLGARAPRRRTATRRARRRRPAPICCARAAEPAGGAGVDVGGEIRPVERGDARVGAHRRAGRAPRPRRLRRASLAARRARAAAARPRRASRRGAPARRQPGGAAASSAAAGRARSGCRHAWPSSAPLYARGSGKRAAHHQRVLARRVGVAAG